MKKQLLAMFVLVSGLQGSKSSSELFIEYESDKATLIEEAFHIKDTKVGRRASKRKSSKQRGQAACLAQTQANGNSLSPKKSKLARNLKN